VILGRGFSQQEGEELHELFNGEAKEPVLWVVGNKSNGPRARNGPPPGTAGDNGPPPNVKDTVLPIFKGILENWKKQGATKGELVLY
jgi:hypothetical protein